MGYNQRSQAGACERDKESIIMENSIYKIETLFNNAIFHIPQFQRAYSWEEEHLEAFLEDLRQQARASQQSPDKKYFLGTLLLHHRPELPSEGGEHLYIVDGQQRLTTSVLFIASAMELAEKKKLFLSDKTIGVIKRAFIYDDIAQCQKFHTIEEDEPLFQSKIIRTSAANIKAIHSTPSSKNLNFARKYFQENVLKEEWPSLLTALREARVMVYVVNNSADATQIFELQNDRGKQLTALEAVKSFLMHAVYLNSKTPEDKLGVIQTNFSRIFRTIEEIDSIKNSPDEDSILSYYCVAFTPWKSDEWRNPKKLAKSTIADLSLKEDKADIVAWIEEFVGGLVDSFDNIKQILIKRDSLLSFSELFVLGRMAPFWPLIMKTWKFDQTDKFNASCKIMEIFAFRGYAISNMRSDSGQPTLYTKARDFSGNFDTLIQELKEMCKWYNIEKRFLDGLDNPNIYKTDKRDACYLLWKYENYLRRRQGQKQPLLSWRDYFEPRDDASRFSIEHILAQDDPAALKDTEWVQGEPTAPFSEIALHRLGNLVLDSVSPNAAKGKDDFPNKFLYIIDKSIYLSQKELKNFATEKDDNGNPVWGVSQIKERHQILVEFAKKEWDFEKI